jgi:hypothetical protein
MRARLIVGFFGLLAGCVSVSSKLDRGLRPYVGQNIAVLSGVFGDPESVQAGRGEMQYTWTVDNRFVITRPRPAMGINDVSQMLPVLPALQVTEDVPVHYLCNLQVVTDQDGHIKTFHTNGNEGCQRFVSALDPRSL